MPHSDLRYLSKEVYCLVRLMIVRNSRTGEVVNVLVRVPCESAPLNHPLHHCIGSRQLCSIPWFQPGYKLNVPFTVMHLTLGNRLSWKVPTSQRHLCKGGKLKYLRLRCSVSALTTTLQRQVLSTLGWLGPLPWVNKELTARNVN